MADKAYLSNISPAWSIARQKEVIGPPLPGGAVAAYLDELKPRHLRRRSPDDLVERAVLCRPTGRRGPEIVRVASIGVMAWRQDDFARVVEALGARRAALVSHHDGETFDLQSATARQRAIELFPTARKEGGRQRGRAVGARRSAEIRNAASKAAAEAVRARWGASGTPRRRWSPRPALAATRSSVGGSASGRLPWNAGHVMRSASQRRWSASRQGRSSAVETIEPPSRPAPLEPLESAGMFVADVVDFAGYKIRAGRRTTAGHGPKCGHKSLLYSGDERRVWCDDCKQPIDAFDALMVITHGFQEIVAAARSDRHKAAEAKQAVSFAAERRGYRGMGKKDGAMLPALPARSFAARLRGRRGGGGKSEA